METTTPPTVSLRTVCLDCDDAHAMARFYGELFGWQPTVVEPDWVLIRDPRGGTGVSFQQTPTTCARSGPRSPDGSRR